jgi:hypothetical protein
MTLACASAGNMPPIAMCSTSTAHRRGWRSKWMAKRIRAVTGRCGMRLATDGSLRRTSKCYSASDVLSNLEGVVREIMTVALERRDRFQG